MVDLTAEPLPTAETKIHIYSIFGSVEVLVPNDVGIRITGVSLLSSLKVRRQEVGSGIFSVNEYLTPGYELSARKLHIDLVLIFGSAKVRR
jgi:predicted membrane protein